MILHSMQHRAWTLPRQLSSSTPDFSVTKWLDLSIIKRKGRAFEADKALVPIHDALIFPGLPGYDLNGRETLFPERIKAKVKLVSFSFTDYGFNLNKTYSEPFLDKYAGHPDVKALEITFVEYSFLQVMKGVFATNLKKRIPESQHARTQVTFGGVMNFATNLKLPNKFTGYSFLLDRENRIRWRACGVAEENADLMLRAIEALLKEPN